MARLSLVPVESLDRRKVQQDVATRKPFAPARVYIVEWSASLRCAPAGRACVWAPCDPLWHDEIG